MIRPATVDDLPLVRELWSEFSVEIPDEPWRDDDLEEDLAWLEAAVRDEVVLLAGDVGLAVARKKGERLGFLEVLYVRPRARGSGVSRELTLEAARLMRGRGADVLELEVLASNTRAQAIYEHWGFRPAELTLAAPIDALEERLDDTSTGPTFGAVHVQTDDVDKVSRDAAKALHVEADVEREEGWVRVRSDLTDADPARLKRLAKELSYTSGGIVLALGVERGAVVRYNLFERGADVDEYLSVPEFYGPLPPGDVYAMGANATVAARLTGADPARVRAVARTAASPADLPPAQELYEQIAAVMGVRP
ncbi:MAG TPA: GNAT family N-acetyltransferase [Gaiellaceae bacterium]|nr:GNAT family N-acetyltransferase [Gaiellaceae bacterium]